VAPEVEQIYCPARHHKPEDYNLEDHSAYKYVPSSDITSGLKHGANDA